MEEKSFLERQFERQFEKRKIKYVAKHGEILFLAKTVQLPNQHLGIAILYLVCAVIWLTLGIVPFTRYPAPAFCIAGLWCVIAGLWFAELPYYYKKKFEALSKLKKIEAAIYKAE